ncbi:MAG TPA: hypothetical protein VJR89_13870 [Polyangiales bacterium]|nr:hypothetical protein [Polyangiales bacterium]
MPGPTTPSTPAGTPTMPSTGTPATGAAGTGASVTPPTAMPTQPPATGTSGTGSTPAPSGTAGTGSTPTMGAAGAPGTMGGAPYPDLRGMCNINSGYPDDKACVPAPSAEEGIQIHVGPKDYTNQAEVAKFLMQPGDESSQCWTFHTPNDKDFFYQTFMLSGRAGTHHIINTMYNTPLTDGGFGACADPGTGTNGAIIDNLPGASKAYMPRGIVAPENKDIGRKIPPKAASQADMHYFNFTDKPIVREFWMNIYSVKPEDVKRQAAQIRAMGGLSWLALPIAPGTDMTYKYECPIKGNGRILALLGHYHSHGKHFTASIRRKGGATEKVFEMYDYLDPAMFEYDSVSKNPAFTDKAAGAVSGLLEVKDGDTLLWDCHIINDGNVGLTYTNEVKTGEMCNLWGSSLDIQPLNCVVP